MKNTNEFIEYDIPDGMSSAQVMHLLEGNTLDFVDFVKKGFTRGFIFLEKEKYDIYAEHINPDRIVLRSYLKGYRASHQGNHVFRGKLEKINNKLLLRGSLVARHHTFYSNGFVFIGIWILLLLIISVFRGMVFFTVGFSFFILFISLFLIFLGFHSRRMSRDYINSKDFYKTFFDKIFKM